MYRRESVSSQHEEGQELNPFKCGTVLSVMRKVMMITVTTGTLTLM